MDAAPASLRRRWLLTALLFWGITLAAGRWLGSGWTPEQTGRWLGLVAVVLAYELWLLWRHLDRHRPSPDHPLLPTFGAGNTLTLYRGLSNGLLAGFLLAP